MQLLGKVMKGITRADVERMWKALRTNIPGSTECEVRSIGRQVKDVPSFEKVVAELRDCLERIVT